MVNGLLYRAIAPTNRGEECEEDQPSSSVQKEIYDSLQGFELRPCAGIRFGLLKKYCTFD